MRRKKEGRRDWGIRLLSDRACIRIWVSAFFFLFPLFLWLHLWHMKVFRLGVKSELQLPAYAIGTRMLDPPYAIACSNVGSLTHWERLGMELASSQRQHWVFNPLSYSGNSPDLCILDSVFLGWSFLTGDESPWMSTDVATSWGKACDTWFFLFFKSTIEMCFFQFCLNKWRFVLILTCYWKHYFKHLEVQKYGKVKTWWRDERVRILVSFNFLLWKNSNMPRSRENDNKMIPMCLICCISSPNL